MYDEGISQILEIDDALIVLNKRVADYNALKEGTG